MTVGDDTFADVLASNRGYADRFRLAGLDGNAARSLAVLTCMDSRIDPLGALGLQPGDAKILRNAGARVTGDVLRTLVLATYLLRVDRFMVMAHTGCRMAAPSDSVLKAAIRDAGGPDTGSPSGGDGRQIRQGQAGGQNRARCKARCQVQSRPRQ